MGKQSRALEKKMAEDQKSEREAQPFIEADKKMTEEFKVVAGIPLDKRPWPLEQKEADKDPLDEGIKKGRIRIYNGPK